MPSALRTFALITAVAIAGFLFLLLASGVLSPATNQRVGEQAAVPEIAGSFFFSYFLAMLSIGAVGYYVYSHRRELDTMCCMMNGMTFGNIAGFVTGVLYAIPTGDYLMATIYGTTVGWVVGIPFGKMGSGGVLGKMEGVMAGPMGGMMGAMLGFMIRPFNIQIFMIFFFFVLLYILGETAYMVYNIAERKMPKSVIAIAGFSAALILLHAIVLPYSIENPGINQPTGVAAVAQIKQAVQQPTAAQPGQGQEIDVRVGLRGYNPDTITLKKGIPVKMNLIPEPNAGCTRAFTIPDLGVKKIVKGNEPETITFTPEKEGTFTMMCGMGMFRGKVIVKA